MKVTAADSRPWRAYRRRLAWRPRLPRWIVQWWPEGWPDDNIIGLIVGIYATLLLLIMSPFLLWYLLSWLAALIATPLTWLARTQLGRPTPVIAHTEDNPWAEWTGQADGPAAADSLVDQVATELRQHGTPSTLTTPPAKLIELTTMRQTPIIERLTTRRK
ncbi:hypothetical protein, partial [Mangrovihabitans endophyticus]|uniref:hypothetical protein n=1 Tax=Mangrovihabitans endophyticus TaxID=1751298 RepID=UPI00166B6B1C